MTAMQSIDKVTRWGREDEREKLLDELQEFIDRQRSPDRETVLDKWRRIVGAGWENWRPWHLPLDSDVDVTMSVHELRMSLRTHKLLAKGEIYRIEDITGARVLRLLRIEGFDDQALNEVFEVMKAIGCKL